MINTFVSSNGPPCWHYRGCGQGRGHWQGGWPALETGGGVETFPEASHQVMRASHPISHLFWFSESLTRLTLCAGSWGKCHGIFIHFLVVFLKRFDQKDFFSFNLMFRWIKRVTRFLRLSWRGGWRGNLTTSPTQQTAGRRWTLFWEKKSFIKIN